MPKIALIDDQILVGQGLIRLLKELNDNYDVMPLFSSAHEFLTYLKHHPNNHPDIAIIDYTMPGLNGVDLSNILTKLHPAIKKLAISTDSFPDWIAAFIYTGCKGFIDKGSEPTELEIAIETTLKNKYHYNNFVCKKMVKDICDNNTKMNFPSGLSESQFYSIKLCKTNLPNKGIAAILEMKEDAFDKHLQRLFTKFNVANRVALCTYADEHNLILNKHYFI